MPVLAEQYGNELEKGELKLTFDMDRGEFSIFYHQHRFPVDPAEYPRILNSNLDGLQETLGSTHEDFLELQSIITAFSHLPGRRGLTPEQRAERNREKEVQKRRLATLVARSAETREFVAGNVESINGRPDDPRSFDALHEMIKVQAYRFAQWRVAADDINYRRFFDINDLAALCTENERVFNETHKLILSLVAEGKVDGLRTDHPDGLYDPARYFQLLRERLDAELYPQNREAYVIAEKILTGNEHLHSNWPIDGTTGYEFGNLVNGLFVDQASADKMERIYRGFIGVSEDFNDLVYRCKKLILKVVLASELNVLANLLIRIALASRYTCDFTLNSLRSALAEIIASFPVYRTYVNGCEISPEDRQYVNQAIVAGRKRSTAAELSVFDFIRRVLLIDGNGTDTGWYKQAFLRFAMKFQQVTAAVMAKGLEDTAFYRYNRLVSLNEVGGNPSRYGTAPEEFHRANQVRLEQWPDSMLATSTHDSKRSEDVRARINVLSELPVVWRLHLRRWRDWNRGRKRALDGTPAPTRNDEYLLYQTLIGTWPPGSIDDDAWKSFVERIEQYMLKAIREAKEHTSWANTNSEYEDALVQFIRAILARTGKNAFLADIEGFQRRVARIGMFNSLSQSLLKMTSPGVPDIYQGNELLQFSLVDPDNRKPVDYELRLNALRQLQDETSGGSKEITSAIDRADDGRAKLYVTWKTLQTRKSSPALFQRGTYLPLRASGQKSDHVVAFVREYAGRSAIVAVPRLCSQLLGESFDSICDAEVWNDTVLEIPAAGVGCYHNVFTGECIPVSPEASSRQTIRIPALFGNFPVALLLSEPSVADSTSCLATLPKANKLPPI